MYIDIYTYILYIQPLYTYGGGSLGRWTRAPTSKDFVGETRRGAAAKAREEREQGDDRSPKGFRAKDRVTARGGEISRNRSL